MLLDYDVLAVVLSWAPQDDVGRVMRTCRTLYQAGIPRLLDGGVEIESMEHLVSFASFILRDPTRRSRHIRRLAISVSTSEDNKETKTIGSAFTELLQNAYNLETFTIFRTDLLFLDEDQRTIRAMSNLGSLRSFSFCAQDKHLHSLIEGIKAPLTKVDCELFDEHMVPVRDPARIFAQFTDSLRAMRVGKCSFMPTSGPQYPHVTTLHIGESPFILVKDLSRWFPNVRNLRLRIEDDDILSRNEVEQLRTQQQVASGGQLRSLQVAHGSVVSIYTLALRSRVDCVNLQLCSVTELQGYMLSSILESLHPSTLKLKLYPFNFKPRKLERCLRTGADNLKTLSLTVMLQTPSTGVGSRFFRLLTDIFTALASLQVKLLHLRLVWDIFVLGVRDAPNLQEIAQEAISSIPSLGHVVVEYGARSQVWVAVNHSQNETSEREICELTDEEGQRFVHQSTLYKDRDIWDY